MGKVAAKATMTPKPGTKPCWDSIETALNPKVLEDHTTHSSEP